ncbi:uncharacterized protein LOC129918216 [Episyrphus balteatus]|uniref:uncharacterized protein LOC129918216 n=1 Tax=Episyrphus balteatus TaxID=286459 RepID=UPI0024857D02|nr:uncharacterized protein LOC129918216 [Episyrphus balteatus]
MKTKPFAIAASEKMKSAILYPYGPLTGTGCCRMLHAKHLAVTSAIYTLNISILIVLIYAWRISVNVRRPGELEDVYYGVQIAYFAIIGTQMSMIFLSVMLMFGIYKENPGLIVPWIIGFITFMALEAVAMVYSNVLRDHVNKQFDTMCKAEVTFFIARAFINVLAMWGVMRFYNLVRAGITWKGPEAKTTTSLATGCFLFDMDDDDDIYGCDDDDDDDEDDEYYDEEDSSDSSILDHGDDVGSKGRRNHHRRTAGCNVNNNNNTSNNNNNNNVRTLFIKRNKYKISHRQTRLEVIDELEKSAGSGSEENDSLLVAYDSNSIASV